MDTHKITHPRDLATAFKTASETAPGEDRQLHLIFALLQPLVEPETLARCRSPHRANDAEYLDLASLSKDWRNEWRQISAVPHLHIEFDVSLPRLDDGSTLLDMHWQTNHSKDCKVYLYWQDIQNLAILIGTFAKLRASRQVQFSVSRSRVDGLQDTYPDQLEEYLNDLSAF